MKVRNKKKGSGMRMGNNKKGSRMKMSNNKKGSYIMEAAIVLPVIIFVTITAILIIMFFYSQMTERSRMHMTLRSEAGAMTGKSVTLHKTPWDGELYSDKEAIGGRVYGKKYLIMSHRGVLEKKGTFIVEGYASAVDGVAYVRFCNLVKGVAGQ